MILDTLGEALIKSFEALRLYAYLDQHGTPTIGWGSTKGVKPGMRWTLEQCQAAFVADTAGAVAAVNHCATVSLTQNQFNALVDFTFNEGAGALAGSTLLHLLNLGDMAGAAAQFAIWNKIHVGEALVVDNGLVRRRAAETALFLSPS